MKRIIACIMIVSMLIMLAGCGADNSVSDHMGIIDLDNMSVEGKGVTLDGKNINITSGGEYNIFGSLNNGMIYVDTSDSVILSLDNVNIHNEKAPAIYIERADMATVRLASEEASYISTASDSEDENGAIYSKAELVFDGVGSARIVSSSGSGVMCTENVTIDNGDYTIDSGEHGIETDKLLHVRSCYMSVYAKGGKGLKAEKGLTVDDGSISLVTGDEGMESKGTLVINGGSINIEASEDGINTGTPDSEKTTTEKTETEKPEIPHEPPQMPEGGERPPMPDGERPPMPDGERPPMPDMPKIDPEFAKTHSITINGGTLFIKAEGDGIDSNGDLTINGGKIIVDGPSVMDNGSLDCDGTMTIAGGTVLAVSNGGMVQLPRGEENQRIISLNAGNQTSGSYVEVKDADGNVLIDHTAGRDFTNIIISHEKIKSDTEYSIYINGDKVEAEETKGFFGRHNVNGQ